MGEGLLYDTGTIKSNSVCWSSTNVQMPLVLAMIAEKFII